MSRRLLYTMILFLCIISSDLIAQNSQALYFMNLPQRTTLNPALRPTSRVYVGLPVISDISVNINNNFLSFSDIFIGGVISDSTVSFLESGENLDAFIAGLNEKNSLQPEVGIQLFGLGFTLFNDFYFTLDLTERVQSNIAFPRDLLRLAFNGSDDFMGQRVDMSSLRADVLYYHEVAAGVSKNITDKLRVGARAKLLLGMASENTENNGLGLTVNSDYSYTVDADMAMNISGPVSFYSDNKGLIDSVSFDKDRFNSTSGVVSFFTNAGNRGLGLDLGAEYKLTDRVTLSASVTDIGYIRWRTDLTRLQVNKTIELSGLNMQDVYDGSLEFEDVMKDIGDTLKKSVKLINSPAPYTTYLPWGVTVAGSFNLTKSVSFGLLSRTRFIGKQVQEAVTASANINFGNAFSTTLAYTAANQTYDNIGFGFAVRGGYVQFFTLVDNIPLKWTDATKGDRSFPVPENLNTIHARLGLNFVFGNKIKEKKESED